MWNDVGQALRAFRRAPGFTAAVILSLGLGIGANTAIFSVVYAVLMRPLPYANAERLAILWNRSPGLNIAEDWFSTAQYFDIATRHRGFDTLAIALGANYNLTGPGTEPERVGAIRVSSNLLTMLGARPALGRLLIPDDDVPGRAPMAILSHGLWARRYGRDAAIVGQSITLNGTNYRVEGVLPETFSLPREVLPTLGVAEDGQIFLPLPLAADAARIRTREDYNIIGTLKPGVSVASAQAEMDALTARLRGEFPTIYPPNGGLTFSIVPLEQQVSGKIARPLLVLLGAVGCVLLIACVNVANLLLARALARRREMAVRAALGAGRARIVQQLFTEGLMLALGGAALGLALAAAGIRWIHAHPPPDVPRVGSIGIDGTVLLFTLTLSIVAALLFSVAPALSASRLDVHGTLKDAGRGTAGAGSLWAGGYSLRRLLVAAELALAVTLLIGAGLLIRSFSELQQVPPGFDGRGVLTLELTLTGGKYKDAQAVIAGYRQLWERLRAIPGVTAVGGVSSLPMSGFFAWGPITVEGRAPTAGEQFINADQRTVSGDYFAAMGIPLKSGRLFDVGDANLPPPAAPMTRVIVIDERMAQELWPGQAPIGKRIKYGDAASTAAWETVVGVVGRVKQYGLDADARMAFYRPGTQSASRALFVTARTNGDPALLPSAVAREVHAFDKDLPLYHVQPMTSRVGDSLGRQRLAATLLSLFAALALALAAIGVYGVMAYLVSQGTREMGIRAALGATPMAILTLVMRQGAAITVAGLAVGLTGAYALTRVLESLLYGVSARDPITFAIAASALACVALVAVTIPATRAARVDPIAALRED